MKGIEKGRSNWIFVMVSVTLVLSLLAGFYLWYKQLPVEEPREYDGIFVWVENEEFV